MNVLYKIIETIFFTCFITMILYLYFDKTIVEKWLKRSMVLQICILFMIFIVIVWRK